MAQNAGELSRVWAAEDRAAADVMPLTKAQRDAARLEGGRRFRRSRAAHKDEAASPPILYTLTLYSDEIAMVEDAQGEGVIDLILESLTDMGLPSAALQYEGPAV